MFNADPDASHASTDQVKETELKRRFRNRIEICEKHPFERVPVILRLSWNKMRRLIGIDKKSEVAEPVRLSAWKNIA